MWMADHSDDLTNAIAELQSRARARQSLEHGTREYEAAVRRETEQIQIVRELAEPTSSFDIKAVDGDV